MGGGGRGREREVWEAAHAAHGGRGQAHPRPSQRSQACAAPPQGTRLGDAALRGGDAVQAEGAQRLVVPRKLALALQHVDLHARLAVGGGGEDLVLGSGERGVAGDDLGGHAAQRLEAQGQGGHLQRGVCEGEGGEGGSAAQRLKAQGQGVTCVGGWGHMRACMRARAWGRPARHTLNPPAPPPHTLTSSSTMSDTSPASTPPCTAAPSATTSSGFTAAGGGVWGGERGGRGRERACTTNTPSCHRRPAPRAPSSRTPPPPPPHAHPPVTLGFFCASFSTSSTTAGMRVEPPTRMTSSMSAYVSLASCTLLAAAAARGGRECERASACVGGRGARGRARPCTHPPAP